MTRYHLPFRRSCQPPVPTFDLAEPTLDKARAARAYIAHVESDPKLLELDAETVASGRPGLDPDEDLTDLQFAHRYLAEWTPRRTNQVDEVDEDALIPNDAGGTAVAPRRANLARAGRASLEGTELVPWTPPRFGKVVIADGFTLMNSQVLRSRVFQSPPLDTWLRALGDHSRFGLMVRGFSPTSDHYQLLLFTITKMSGKPDPKLGAAVQFTTNELITALGWSRHSSSYARLKQLIDELQRVRLTFEVEGEDKRESVVSDAPLFGRVTQSRSAGKTYHWELVLTDSLLALFGLGRNTLLEMRACRALHTSTPALWLYGFVASQEPGKPKTFDAKQLCRSCGLSSARDVDNRKSLVKALKSLQDGSAKRRKGDALKLSNFEPIVAEWSLNKTMHGWKVTIMRTSAFTRVLPGG